jgi:hypothetical protein
MSLARLDLVTTAQLRALGNRPAAEGAMRARCMAVPVDATTALCRVLGQYKMYVDLRDTGFAPHLMFEGYWEYWITEFMWRNVRPGQVALDLGANHGTIPCCWPTSWERAARCTPSNRIRAWPNCWT